MKRMILLAVLSVGLITANAQSKMAAKQDTLTLFRSKITQLDKDIVHLLGQRMEAAKVIGEYKMAHKMEVLQSNRFNEVLQAAVSHGKEEGLSEAFIKELYEAIHKESIRQQEALKK